jgi:hypothetical protein
MSSSSELESPDGDVALAPADDSRRVSLCEALDRMLNTGVVVAGEVVISVADIDLIYLNVQLLLASIETACGLPRYPAGAPPRTASES